MTLSLCIKNDSFCLFLDATEEKSRRAATNEVMFITHQIPPQSDTSTEHLCGKYIENHQKKLS